MNNFLDNGTVMPHGLLACDPSDHLRGLNKSYNNTALRFGVIRKIYPISDANNISKLSTEYDVDVIEQDMNRGIAPVTYKNCLCVDSLGSMPDFLEKNLRAQTQSKNHQLPLTKGQNGATVLVLCLDATTGKGVILGGLNHPDRPTTLSDSQPRLSGEYNGVAIAINPDGSCSLIFKGATDNSGKIVDSSQGNTTFKIETDGSFQFDHSTITIRADRSGVLTINAKSDGNVTIGGNATVTVAGNTTVTTTGNTTVKTTGNTEIDTQGNTTVNTTGNAKILTKGSADIIASGLTTIDGSAIKLGQSAIEAVIKGNTLVQIFNNHTHIGNLGQKVSPPLQPMEPALSTHVFTQ